MPWLLYILGSYVCEVFCAWLSQSFDQLRNRKRKVNIKSTIKYINFTCYNFLNYSWYLSTFTINLKVKVKQIHIFTSGRIDSQLIRLELCRFYLIFLSFYVNKTRILKEIKEKLRLTFAIWSFLYSLQNSNSYLLLFVHCIFLRFK